MNETDKHNRPLLVALTGGVASGKTSVSDRLAEKGVPVIDTDLIARDVVSPGHPGLERVVEAFGSEILDESGALDRRRLRERVFARPEQRQRLESILHPLIEEDARRQIAGHESADYVVLVVPLLVESGLFEDADLVVVVDVPESIQVRRLLERDGVDQEQAEAMLAAQASRAERLAIADEVIDNSGSLAALMQASDALHDRLRLLSRRRVSLRGP
ncbi:dephospho-CoA kinase [Wenzhouxiangella sp. EGI_FJ10409]|uniref:dephospho-CoA kinase n=1 Tax=Wenzhouxiangella sp. EGI_FJ10409 TaxID=3243767 RepID=UPI0035DB7319